MEKRLAEKKKEMKAKAQDPSAKDTKLQKDLDKFKKSEQKEHIRQETQIKQQFADKLSKQKSQIDKDIQHLKKTQIDVKKESQAYQTLKLTTELKQEESRLKLEN